MQSGSERFLQVWLRLAAVAAVAVAVLGCPRGTGSKISRSKQRVLVHSYSEPSPVRILVAAPPYLFSASERGLVRWELDTGDNLQLSAEHGLPGDRVEAMTYDVGRGWLWVATDCGVTGYDIDGGTFIELKSPPSALKLDNFAGISMAPAIDGGLWLGHRRGLYYTDIEGNWKATKIREPVNAVFRTRNGDLWIGAESGLIVRRSDGQTEHWGSEKGCDLETIRFIASTPSGGPMAVGEDSSGEQRIVFVLGDSCATYRTSPNQQWLGAALRRDEQVILTPRRLYSANTTSNGARSLSRDGMRLVPVEVNATKPPRSPYVFRPTGAPLPKGSQSITALGDDVFVGTGFLGTARLSYGDEKFRIEWLRQSVLVAGARTLSVACSDRDDCYIATGAPAVWHFTGDGFDREQALGSYTLAFARKPGGDLYAAARSDNEQRIEIYRLTGDRWRKIQRLSIEVPDNVPDLSFARFAQDGSLWLGVRYRDQDGEIGPFGIAVVDVRARRVDYHRVAAGDNIDAAGWPIPVDADDASFLDEEEVWFAASEGAVQVDRDGEVTIHQDPEGTEGDMVRGVAVSSGGIVFAATRSGVATYNGEEWAFPKVLRRRVNDVEVDPDGRLWMATDRGVTMFDGARVHRLDVRRGLLENQIDQIAIDHFGRVWARSSKGFTLITP